MTPVQRRVGADRSALLAFVEEAAAHGYEAVFVATDATDVAEAMGTSFSSPIPVLHERFVPDGIALAMPPSALAFP